MITIVKNVFWSPPIASQHQNSKIGLHHYTRPSHNYHVSKYEEDGLRNKKVLTFINLVVVVVVVVVINPEIFDNTPWRRRSRFRALGGRGWFEGRTPLPGG